jgi:hypothetical protein
MRKVTVSWMRDRYAQTVLTFRITHLYQESEDAEDMVQGYW